MKQFLYFVEMQLKLKILKEVVIMSISILRVIMSILSNFMNKVSSTAALVASKSLEKTGELVVKAFEKGLEKTGDLVVKGIVKAGELTAKGVKKGFKIASEEVADIIKDLKEGNYSDAAYKVGCSALYGSVGLSAAGPFGLLLGAYMGKKAAPVVKKTAIFCAPYAKSALQKAASLIKSGAKSVFQAGVTCVKKLFSKRKPYSKNRIAKNEKTNDVELKDLELKDEQLEELKEKYNGQKEIELKDVVIFENNKAILNLFPNELNKKAEQKEVKNANDISKELASKASLSNSF